MSLLAQDSNQVVLVIHKCHAVRRPDPILLRVIEGKHDGHRHIHHRPVFEAEGIEMKRLEELWLSHETLQWACPALAEHVHPLKVNLREPDLRQARRLLKLRISFRFLNEKLDEFSAIRVDQRSRNPGGGSGSRGGEGAKGEIEGRREMGFRKFGERMGKRGWGFEVKRSHCCHYRLTLSLLLLLICSPPWVLCALDFQIFEVEGRGAF